MSEEIKWHRVVGLNEMKDGEVRRVEAAGQHIALTYYQEKYGALDDLCPHAGGSLGAGLIDRDGALRCPLHAWAFCPFTGDLVASGSRAAHPFPLEVREDGVYVGLRER